MTYTPSLNVIQSRLGCWHWFVFYRLSDLWCSVSAYRFGRPVYKTHQWPNKLWWRGHGVRAAVSHTVLTVWGAWETFLLPPHQGWGGSTWVIIKLKIHQWAIILGHRYINQCLGEICQHSAKVLKQWLEKNNESRNISIRYELIWWHHKMSCMALDQSCSICKLDKTMPWILVFVMMVIWIHEQVWGSGSVNISYRIFPCSIMKFNWGYEKKIARQYKI